MTNLVPWYTQATGRVHARSKQSCERCRSACVVRVAGLHKFIERILPHASTRKDHTEVAGSQLISPLGAVVFLAVVVVNTKFRIGHIVVVSIAPC